MRQQDAPQEKDVGCLMTPGSVTGTVDESK